MRRHRRHAGTHTRAYQFSIGALVAALSVPAQAAEQRPGEEAQERLSTVTVFGAALENPRGPVEGYRAGRTATATRTNTAIEDLPFQVDVVSRQSIEDRGSIELSEALETAPGVSLASTSSNRAEAFLVRGFADYSYVIDGFPLSPTAGRADAFLDLANVERIEVLKGPASTLYGRGQPGGVINVVTRQPTSEFHFDGTVQAGSDDFYRTQGSVSGPLNDSGTLTGRATLAGQTDHGFQDHPISTSKRQFSSLALQWAPDHLTRVNLSVDHTHQDVPFDRGLIVTSDNNVSLPAERFLSEAWSTAEARVTRTTVGAERIANDWLTLSADVRYDDAMVEDTGIDLRGLEDDGRTLNRRYTDRREDNTNLDVRLEALAEFDTRGIEHQLLLGSEYVHSTLDFYSARANIEPIDIYNPVYGAVRPQAEFNSAFDTTSEMFSLYLQDQITFTPQWHLLAGLRHDQLSQRQNIEQSDNPPDINDRSWTGRIGVVYQPIEPLSLYASYSESFNPQLGTTRNNEALDPEEGNQYEVGAKWAFNERLSLTASVFEITKENVATTDPQDEDFSVLSGEQRSRGAELNLVGEPLTGWQLSASAAYIDARITEDEEYEVGNRLGGVPYWSGSLWSTYTLQGGPAAGLELGAGAFYVGAREGDIENSYDVDGYTRFDASIAYPLTEHIELALNMKNLTDEAYILAPVSRSENYAGAPRSVLGSVRVSY